jgi:hypothetical protein
MVTSITPQWGPDASKAANASFQEDMNRLGGELQDALDERIQKSTRKSAVFCMEGLIQVVSDDDTFAAFNSFMASGVLPTVPALTPAAPAVPAPPQGGQGELEQRHEAFTELVKSVGSALGITLPSPQGRIDVNGAMTTILAKIAELQQTPTPAPAQNPTPAPAAQIIELTELENVDGQLKKAQGGITPRHFNSGITKEAIAAVNEAARLVAQAVTAAKTAPQGN